MDYKKYQKTKSDLEHYDNRIATLKDLLKEANLKKQEICNECSHDFVFIYDEESLVIGHPENGLIKHANCLVCGQYIRLNENYIEFESEKPLQSKHIIDATKFLSGYTQKCYRGNENVAYIVAKNEFNQMVDADTEHFKDEKVIKIMTEAVKELDCSNIARENARKQKYEENKLLKSKI